jgi:phosphatidylserine/phosphatidylglycerophosphate/cardiolipin synthase-like enzyme
MHARWLTAILLCGNLLGIPSGAGAQILPASGTIETLFTPWDDAEGAIVRALGEAKHSIHVQAYLITSRAITKALLAAQARGIRIEILTDRKMLENDKNSQVPQLAANGIAVWLETRYAIAHNKILLVDAEQPQGIVITGSYNFTWSAQARNAENLLILRGNRTLQQRYLNNWQRHRAEAQPYSEETHHDR